MLEPQPVPSEQRFSKVNCGALPLHEAIVRLESDTPYPLDPFLIELLSISREVEPSDFSKGSSSADFIQRAAAHLSISVPELLTAAKNDKHPLNTPATYTLAAYQGGKEGIEDALRFIRWRYFALFNDEPTLSRSHPAVDSLRAEWLAEVFLGAVWKAYLGNPDTSPIKVVFGPYPESPVPEGTLDIPDTIIHVANKVSDWLNLSERRVYRYGGVRETSRPHLANQGCCAIAEITFKEGWQWPHRSEEWSLVLNPKK